MAAGHGVGRDRWQRVSDQVIDGFAGRFVRVEPRRAAAGFVTGLLTDLEIKTSWQLAEQAGHARPDKMQRLLYRAKWDADACTARKLGFGYAAWEYSLIRPLRIFLRRIRVAARSTTGAGAMSVALGGRWWRP
jgi:hypothetical protein